MCNHLQKYQKENEEHLFQFKEFLENYVATILNNEIEKIIKQSNHSNNENDNNDDSLYDYFSSILLALSSLIPLKPFLTDEKLQTLLESCSKLLQNSKEKSFVSILKSTKILCSNVMETKPTFDSLLLISLSFSSSFFKTR